VDLEGHRAGPDPPRVAAAAMADAPDARDRRLRRRDGPDLATEQHAVRRADHAVRAESAGGGSGRGRRLRLLPVVGTRRRQGARAMTPNQIWAAVGSAAALAAVAVGLYVAGS